MAKKVTILKDACIGCGLCIASVPSVFSFDDEGKAEAGAVDAADEAAVDEAVASCPVQAIVAE